MCGNQYKNGGVEPNADYEVTDNGGENTGDHGNESFYIRRVRLCWVLPNAPNLCREIEDQQNNVKPPFNYARLHIGAHLSESIQWMSFVDNTDFKESQSVVELKDISINADYNEVAFVVRRGMFVKEYDNCVSIHLELTPNNFLSYGTYTIARILAKIVQIGGNNLYKNIYPLAPNEMGPLKGGQPAFTAELVHECKDECDCTGKSGVALDELVAISGLRAPLRISNGLELRDEYPYIRDDKLPLGLIYEFKYDELDELKGAFLRAWGKGGPQSGIVHHFPKPTREEILTLKNRDDKYQEVRHHMDYALDRLGTVTTGLTVLTVFEQYARQTLEKMWAEGPKTLSHRIETLHQLEKGIRSQFELLAMVGSYTASGMDVVRQDISNVVRHLSDRLHMAWLQTLVDAVRVNDILGDTLGREPRM